MISYEGVEKKMTDVYLSLTLQEQEIIDNLMERRTAEQMAARLRITVQRVYDIFNSMRSKGVSIIPVKAGLKILYYKFWYPGRPTKEELRK